MGRIYVANFEDVAITAAQDLFQLLAAATGIVKVHRIHLEQSSDVGDAAEEILELETVRGDGGVTSGSGGSTPTAQPVDNGDAAPATTVEANNTTRLVAGTGTLDLLEKFGWNVRIPFDHVWAPEERPLVTPGDHWTFSLNDAPADSLTVSGSITFEEEGG